jgi:hypothetical protein
MPELVDNSPVTAAAVTAGLDNDVNEEDKEVGDEEVHVLLLLLLLPLLLVLPLLLLLALQDGNADDAPQTGRGEKNEHTGNTVVEGQEGTVELMPHAIMATAGERCDG